MSWQQNGSRLPCPTVVFFSNHNVLSKFLDTIFYQKGNKFLKVERHFWSYCLKHELQHVMKATLSKSLQGFQWTVHQCILHCWPAAEKDSHELWNITNYQYIHKHWQSLAASLVAETKHAFSFWKLKKEKEKKEVKMALETWPWTCFQKLNLHSNWINFTNSCFKGNNASTL